MKSSVFQASRPVQWRFLLEMLGLFAIFTYLFLFSSRNDDFYDLSIMLIGIVLAGLAGLAWLVAGQKAAMPLGRFVLLYAGVFVLASITSIDPRRSFGEGVYFLAAVFLFAGSAEVITRGLGAGTFLQAFILAGTVTALMMWVGFGIWYAGWLAASPGQLIPAITYRLPIPNTSAIFLNVQLLLTVCYALTTRSKAGRILLGLNLVSILGLSILASSRAAWLGAAGGLALVGFLFLRVHFLEMRKIWEGLKKKRWPVGLLVLGVLVLGALGGYIFIRQSNYPTHVPIIGGRTPYWQPAWDAFISHPILGTGPFTYVSTFVTENSVPPSGVYVHGHSVLLNALGEMGFLGAATLVLLFGAACLALFRMWKADDPAKRPQVWASIGLLAAFTLNGILDCFHTEPMGMWSLFIVLGVTLANPPGEGPRRFFSRPWWVVVLVVGALLNYLTLIPLDEGTRLADNGQWAAADQKLDEAVKVDPGSAIAWQQRGLALAAVDLPGTANPNAQAAFMKTVSLDPNWGANHLNLGALDFAAGDLEKAKIEMSAAVKDAPDYALYQLNLGQVLEAGGDLEGAIAAYSQALKLNPEWHEAYFWRSSVMRRQAFAEFNRQFPPGPVPTLAELEQAVQDNPNAALPYLSLAEAYLQAGRLDDAGRMLKLAQLGYVAQPVVGMEFFWQQAALWAAQGKFNDAAGLGLEVLNRYQSAGINGPGSDGRMTLYAQWGFRRPAMQLEFVPQVTTIALPDHWGKRLALVADWFEKSGDGAQTQAIRQTLLERIPDFGQLK